MYPAKGQPVCYVLASSDSHRTYVGYTIDLSRRIRQHNGELSGGARATRGNRPYRVLFCVEGFANHREAMSFERCLKNTSRHKRGNPVGRRVYGLRDLALHPRWTSRRLKVRWYSKMAHSISESCCSIVDDVASWTKCTLFRYRLFSQNVSI
jgi:predicted GIY-YIG superfamily endonuclease